jgi:ubiquinone/menaquinone biosynthesis C-methylase UbiE
MLTQHVNPQHRVNVYFESAAPYWKDIYSDDGLLPSIYRYRHNTALGWIRRLGLGPDARILEVGCGAGRVALSLARSGYTVDALDSTAAMLRLTVNDAVEQGLHDRVRTYSADVHALPFRAQTFDLVIAIGVLPWLHSERMALQEMQRVLKPGGHLLVTADNNARLNRIVDPLSCPLFAPLRAVAKRFLRLCSLWSPSSGPQPKRHYPHHMNRMICDSGFRILKSYTLGFGPFTLLGKQVFDKSTGIRLHWQLQTLAFRSSLSPLRWAGSHHLILATKATPNFP